MKLNRTPAFFVVPPILLMAACGTSILGGGGGGTTLSTGAGGSPGTPAASVGGTTGTGGGPAPDAGITGAGGSPATDAGITGTGGSPAFDAGITGTGGSPASDAGTTGTGGSPASDAGTCGACVPGAVCNPITMLCEPACDGAGGLQPGAAWPMVGGCPTRRGLSPFAGAQVANVKWSYDSSSGEGGSGLVIDAAGVVYTSTSSNVLALRPDGSLKLMLPVIPFGELAVGVDGTLYVPSFGASGLTAFDPTSGMVMWAAGAQSNQGVSVAIRGDRTILSTSGAQVFAATPAGALAWSTLVNGNVAIDSSPAVAPGGRAYVVTLGGLVALEPDGTVAWTRAMQASVIGDPAIGPDGHVYASNAGHVYAFQPDGTALWDVALAAPMTQPHLEEISIAPDGTLYVAGSVNSGSALYHLSPADGSVLWQYTVPGNLAGKPVIDAVGNIYVALGGFVYALRPDATQIWVFSGGFDGGCQAVALGSAGTVYASCSGIVYALGP